MKKIAKPEEKKAFKGWVDPMATPYHYKKG